jgi:hypothetical protein
MNSTIDLSDWVTAEGWLTESPIVKKRYGHEEDAKYFGGNGNKALERDSDKCVQCGTQKSLLIHHKDSRSLYSKNFTGIPNNDLGNLITLCYFCHQEVHNRNVTSLNHAIRRYVSYFNDTKVMTTHGMEGIITEYVSGSVLRLKINDGSEKMFSIDSLLFLRKTLDEFIVYVQNIYENHCFNCKDDVNSHSDSKCSKCDWYICSHCGECGCGYWG